MENPPEAETINEVVDREKWVYDSSADHKGRVPLRVSTGTWKAAIFVIVMEFRPRNCCEERELLEGSDDHNAIDRRVLADAYLGRFPTVVPSTIIYLAGLSLMTASRFAPRLKPCESNVCDKASNIHQVVFFVALYLISVGTGGHKPSLGELRPGPVRRGASKREGQEDVLLQLVELRNKRWPPPSVSLSSSTLKIS
ncbi:hypothetical protein H6P81_021406 [Aristolochia fimbriata]|uniref:Uncharacterized protein n=1 Tax=Aristolochia fimbriata TaxID=158543 RepID=A0AAV7DR13_ARIFI|nr:hypothetical protein H6P81_021406 [Aristolochia fimbriata]